MSKLSALAWRVLAAALLGLAAAAPARAAAPFEAQAVQVSQLLHERFQAARPAPPPALPERTPKRLQRLFADGWAESVRALRRPACLAFFQRAGAPAEPPE